MIVCYCNSIDEETMRAAIRGLLAANPCLPIVPRQVYAALGKRGRCFGCSPEIIRLIGEERAAMAPGGTGSPTAITEPRKRSD